MDDYNGHNNSDTDDTVVLDIYSDKKKTVINNINNSSIKLNKTKENSDNNDLEEQLKENESDKNIEQGQNKIFLIEEQDVNNFKKINKLKIQQVTVTKKYQPYPYPNF
jgi:hypothetical protein